MFIRETTVTAAKAVAFAAVCVPLAAAAHALAGGGMASPETMLLAGMPIAVATYLCAGRGSRRAAWLFGVLTLAQACLHVLFSAGDHSAAHGTGPSASMALLHIGATALAVLWTAKAEPALPRLTSRLRDLAAALRHSDPLAIPTPPAPPADAFLLAHPRPPASRVMAGAEGRRGPPTAPRPADQTSPRGPPSP